MIKIFIDPGHGGTDPGAIGNGLREKDLTLAIAKKIRDRLMNYENVQVKLSREDDETLSLSSRTRMANQWGADYFISIHINSATGKSGTGFETFIYNGSVTQATIASQNAVHAEIVQKTGFYDRGKKRANFLVIRESKMEAIITENGFINNPADAAKLKQDSFLDKIAEGHEVGIAKAFGLKKKAAATASAGQVTPRKEEDNVNNLFNPSNEELRNAVRGVLNGFEQYDPDLSKEWRWKFDNSQLPISDALSLLFLALHRGYIPRNEPK